MASSGVCNLKIKDFLKVLYLPFYEKRPRGPKIAQNLIAKSTILENGLERPLRPLRLQFLIILKWHKV